MAKTMGRWGVGLIFAPMSGIILTLFITLHYAFFTDFNFILPRNISQMFGIFFVVLGLVFYIASSIQLHGQFTKRKLITNGFYSFSRNPIYSSWILFIIPGSALIIDSVLLLLAPVLLYIMFRFLVVREEEYLEREYGDEYLEYKKRTGRIMPKLF